MTLDRSLSVSRGDLLVFLCAVAFALHMVAVARYTPGDDPVALTFVQFLVVSGGSLLLSLVAETPPALSSPPLWGALIATAFLGTSLAFLVQNAVQRFTSPTHTALIFASEPVFAALFAWWWAAEILTTRGWIGAALLVAGMAVTELGSAERQGKADPSP